MATAKTFNNQRTENLFGSDNQSESPKLTSPISFTDNGESYEVSTELVDIGGESQVYFATAMSTGNRCIAKVFTSMFMFTSPYLEERKSVISFLREHTDYRKYHIMPLLASGKVEMVSGDKSKEYPIDILPYCQDRDFHHSKKRFDYAELRSRVIPSLLVAINTLHTNGFIHWDIKPANIFELDGTIVLSDFGTAAVIGNGANKVTKTVLVRYTPGYSPPEISVFNAIKESDYFSLGCTLMTLYCGKHPYEDLLNSDNIFEFTRAVLEEDLMFECKIEDEPLKHLINALTRARPSDRVGYEGVSLWLADEKAFYDKYIAT